MGRHIGLGAESTYGTKADPSIYLEVTQETLGLKRNPHKSKTVRSEVVRKVVELSRKVEGDLGGELDYQTAAHLFYYLLGSVDTTDNAPDYTHVSPASTGIGPRRPMTIEASRDSDTITYKYLGTVFQAFNVTGAVGQVATWNAGVLGKGELREAAVTQTPTYPPFDMVIPSEIKLEIAEKGQALAEFDTESFTLNVAFPASERRRLGNKELAKVPRTADALDAVLEVVYFAEDVSVPPISLDDGVTEVTAKLTMTNAANKQIAILLPVGWIEDTTPNMTGREELRGTMRLHCYFDTVATGSMQSTIINQQSTVP